MSEANGVGSLTQAEQDYLNSGGQNSDGLVKELQPDGAAAAPAEPAAKTDAPVAPAAAAAPAAGAAPAAPEEAEVGEEEVATPDGKGKRRMVDYRAHKAAKARAKELETKLEEERQARVKDNQERAVVNERLRLLTAAVETAPAADESAAPVQPETPPDPNVDVIGHAAYLQKTVDELKGQIGQMAEQATDERAQSSTIRAYRENAVAFAQKTPDFGHAYNTLFETRRRQMWQLGRAPDGRGLFPDGRGLYTPEQINKFLYDEELHLVRQFAEAGISPAEGLYYLAQSYGYRPQASAPTNGAAAASANGATPAAAATPAAPAAIAAPAGNVTEEIERIQKGQQAARSLSQGAGGGGDELSIETLANMPMEDFEKLVRTKGGAVERAMGRAH